MQRGLGKPVRCGGSLRCRNWRGFPHERHRGAEPIGSDRRKTTGKRSPFGQSVLRTGREAPPFALKVPSERWTRAEGSPVCFADDGATAPLCAVQEATARFGLATCPLA